MNGNNSTTTPPPEKKLSVKIKLKDPHDKELVNSIIELGSDAKYSSNINNNSTKMEDSQHSPSSPNISSDQPTVNPSALKTFEGNSLPYDLSSLKWEKSHKFNKENTYCYCGKPRTKYGVMLQCQSCKQWFHLECMKNKFAHPPLAGDWSYIFRCSLCTGTQQESLELVEKNWADIVRVALYNLLLQERQRGGDKHFFQYKEEICSFINKHWDSLCYGKTRTKTWENTISSALSTKAHLFQPGPASGFWGLRDEEDPSNGTASVSLGPSSKIKKDKKPGSSSSSSSSSAKLKKKRTADTFDDNSSTNPSSSSLSSKSNKSKKPKQQTPVPIRHPVLWYDPRRYRYTEMVLAKENSAPQMKYEDKFTATNERGYRMTRYL